MNQRFEQTSMSFHVPSIWARWTAAGRGPRKRWRAAPTCTEAGITMGPINFGGFHAETCGKMMGEIPRNS